MSRHVEPSSRVRARLPLHLPLYRASKRPLVPMAGMLGLLLAAPAAAQDVLAVFEGSESSQNLGEHVAAAGDVDGDGTPDFLIGNWIEGGRLGTGLLSGADFSLLALLPDARVSAGGSDLDGDGVPDIALGDGGPQVQALSGASFGELWSDDGVVIYFGHSLATGFDLDGDGHGDVIAGSGADGFLDTGGDTLRIYSGDDGSVLRELDAYMPFDEPQGVGWSVAGYRDVDGDGHDEYLSGIPFTGGVTGPADGTLTEVGIVRLYDGATGAVLHTWAGDLVPDALGWSVATGDVDGDGIDDVIAATGTVSGPLNPTPRYARAWSGADFSELWSFSDGVDGPTRVEVLDDLDGDGAAEVALGCSYLARLSVLSGASGTLLFELHGEPGDETGSALAAVGDVDGDGRGDFLVGASWASPIFSYEGRVTLYSGRPPPFTSLHGGLAGASGSPPQLRGQGTLEPGSTGLLRVTGAQPLQPLLLFFDLAVADLPFLGGTLVPGTNFTPLAFTTGADGKLELPWASWPAGVPAYTEVFAQAWVADAGAPVGAAASAALRLWTP